MADSEMLMKLNIVEQNCDKMEEFENLNKCTTELNSETKLNSPGKFKVKYDLGYFKVTGGINKCFNHFGGGDGEGEENCEKKLSGMG